MYQFCFIYISLNIYCEYIHIVSLVTYNMVVVVDSSISMMSVLLWMGSGVAVEAYPRFAGSATSLTYKVDTRNLLDNRIQCFVCLEF